MPIQKILQNTSFNIKLTNDGINGYRWVNDLNISFQGKDACGTIKEIIKMIHLNKYSIDICIGLQTSQILYFTS
jgi:hypothetical protein